MRFAQLSCIFMGSHFLKVYRTTKMASGKDDFLYEDDFDAVLAIIDAGMLENDENMASERVTCIKNLPCRENCLLSASFIQKVVYSKHVYQGTRKQNIYSALPFIVSAIVILVV